MATGPGARDSFGGFDSHLAERHLLQGVLQQAPVIVFATDPSGVIALAAGKSLETIGLKPSELIGRSLADVVSDPAVAAESLSRALAGEEVSGVMQFNGRRFEAHHSPMRSTDGRVFGVLGIATELTDREQVADAVLKQHKHLSTLYRINEATAESLDLQAVLEKGLQATMEGLGIELGAIYILDEGGKTLALRAHHSLPEEAVEGLRQVAVGEGISGRAIAEKGPVVLDLSEYPTERILPYLRAAGVQTAASTPLLAAGGTLGAVNLATRRARAFRDDEKDLLQAVGRQLGEAVYRAKLHETLLKSHAELERNSRILLAVYDIDRATASTLDMDQVLHAGLKTIVQALDMEAGSIYLLDDERKMLTMRAAHNIPAEAAKGLREIAVGEGMAGRAAAEKGPVVLDLAEYPSERLRPYLLLLGTRTMASTPLFALGAVLGVVNLSTREQRVFSQEDRNLLESVGRQLGKAVYRAKLHKALRQSNAQLEQKLREMSALNDLFRQYLKERDQKKPKD